MFCDRLTIFTNDFVGKTILGSVGILLQLSRVFSEYLATTKSSIARRFIKDKSILNIITRERHNSDGCILTSRELVILDQFYRSGFDHRLLWIDHEIE